MKNTQTDMSQDTYAGFAERYDWMKQDDPAREQFFRQLFVEHRVAKVLDCACGTGRDLITFHGMGVAVFGSDLSDAMLAQARKNTAEAQVEIPIQKANYCELPEHYDPEFDAVLCLSNAINEALEDAETLWALRSMKAVLRTGGILVISQGQTDASMQNPPRFVPVVNNRDFTRFFVIDYAGDIQAVHIFDFIHTQETCDVQHVTVRLRIRLQDSWNQVLREVGFADVAFFGDWDGTPYDKGSSRRLIAVAMN
jgi:glycine/sarcosine N-methyltransferase